MEMLTTTLKGSDLGYSVSIKSSMSSQNVEESISNFPRFKKLLYPFMLAYGCLIRVEGFMEYPPLSNITREILLELLKSETSVKILRALYPNQTDLIERLIRKTEGLEPSTNIQKLVMLRTANLLLHYKCISLSYCPQLPEAAEALAFWLTQSAAHCTISRILYYRSYTVNESLFGPVMWTKKFPSTVASVLYTQSYVEKYIEDTSIITNLKKLDGTTFLSAWPFCNESEEVSTTSGDQIVLPLVLLDVLAKENPLKKKRLSSFALIAANIPSMKQDLCKEVEPLPSLECE